MLQSVLDHLLEVLVDSPAGSLYYGSDLEGLYKDDSMNEARDFMVKIIKNQQSKPLVERALKIIIRLGIVRSNVDDFLLAASLLQNDKVLGGHCDLRDEIRALPALHGSDQKKEGNE